MLSRSRFNGTIGMLKLRTYAEVQLDGNAHGGSGVRSSKPWKVSQLVPDEIRLNRTNT